ncbi:MAG TPA: enolase C-terminal domain-like protein [Opitutales bacterium]|nr:enolase C-terminal domain-like protein [Opitutales bacterium]
MTKISIQNTDLTFEREPLLHPFGFKGGFLSELWQIAAQLQTASGESATGPGVQSVLWSDGAVFAEHSESGGNALMLAMTDHALQLARGQSFETPFELLDAIFPEVLEYGRKITGRPDLRSTFALNALVPVDLAAWILFARKKGTTVFDDLLSEEFRPALSHRQEAVTKIPLVSYTTTLEDIDALIAQGNFFLKIKIGADPEGDGDQEKMLAWDKERMSEIHERLKDVPCPQMADGKIPYYLDANGRYQKKETLLRLVDHLDKIGALEQVHLLEEPFPEDFSEDVSDIPVRLVADESAHTEEDAIARIDQGYGAVALKPIAKTMSMALRAAKAAHERNIPCFCADLTVNPLMVEWNKNVAARLAPIPGFKMGVLETNGPQNYRNWEKMREKHPFASKEWVKADGAEFPLPDEFYETSGGIFSADSEG